MKFARVRHRAAVHLARIEDGHAVLLEAESDAPRADVMIDAIATGVGHCRTLGGSRIGSRPAG